MMDKLDKAAGAELIRSYVLLPLDGDWKYDRNAMLNMFRKGAMWQSEQNEWISFAERMPNVGDLIVHRQKSICDLYQYQIITFKQTDSEYIKGNKLIEWKKI